MLKLFVFIIILQILFCHTNQKNVLQKEVDWTFEGYFLTVEPSP